MGSTNKAPAPGAPASIMSPAYYDIIKSRGRRVMGPSPGAVRRRTMDPRRPCGATHRARREGKGNVHGRVGHLQGEGGGGPGATPRHTGATHTAADRHSVNTQGDETTARASNDTSHGTKHARFNRHRGAPGPGGPREAADSGRRWEEPRWRSQEATERPDGATRRAQQQPPENKVTDQGGHAMGGATRGSHRRRIRDPTAPPARRCSSPQKTR